MNTAVVLLSGGLDSTTAAAMARGEKWELYGLTIKYGQVHHAELAAARRVANALGFVKHAQLTRSPSFRPNAHRSGCLERIPSDDSTRERR